MVEFDHVKGEVCFINDLLTIFIFWQEDAHVANGKFNSNENEALFGVFDGHGGREVAVFSNKHYEEILAKELKSKGSDVREGLRVSFLNVDVELKTP